MTVTFDSILFMHNQQNGYVYSSRYQSSIWPSGPYGGRSGLIELTNDCVSTFTVLSGGSGYSTTPVAIVGIPWTASLGVTTGQQLAAGGNLYTVVVTGTTGSTMPTFTTGQATDGTATIAYAGRTASIGLIVSGGVITDSTIYSGGSGYIGTQPVHITDTTGSGATAQVLLNAFPTGPLVPGVAYLDTYIIVGTPDGKLWSSGVNDPTTWSALGYITSEAEPDQLTGICKHLNYVAAFSQWSTNFFYDAGTAPPASPLLPAAPYGFEIGCPNGGSITQIDQSIIWVGQSKSTGPGVYLLEGISPTKISTANVDRILSNSTLNTVYSYTFKYNGHTFYILTLLDLNVTIVYDVNEKFWVQWTTYTKDSNGVYKEQFFSPSFYSGNFGPNQVYYLLDYTNGSVYSMSDDTYEDNGQPIFFRVVTPLLDGGTTKRKFYNEVEIVGDKVPATMNIRYTQDDYQNWSGSRQVNLMAERAKVHQLGSSRRRAWEFLSTDNQPIRIEAAEIDFNVGES
jgi:hypothetical protein